MRGLSPQWAGLEAGDQARGKAAEATAEIGGAEAPTEEAGWAVVMMVGETAVVGRAERAAAAAGRAAARREEVLKEMARGAAARAASAEAEAEGWAAVEKEAAAS